MSAPVVVGVGGPHDERTVRWAATEARDRRLRLRLVHALRPPTGRHPGWADAAAPGLQRLALVELDAAEGVAREVVPELEVETAVVEGGVVGVLHAEAAHAALLVVGSDGLGRIGDLLLGGVVRRLAGHVDVPLVVVTADYDPFAPRGDHAPVLVGDDGTPGCSGAWRFAADRSERRGAPLVAVRVAAEHVDRALLDRARGAEVLVLGVAGAWFHHHRATPGVVRRSACPVVVVPPLPLHRDPAEGPSVTTASSSAG